jgi:hypothetical protein
VKAGAEAKNLFIIASVEKTKDISTGMSGIYALACSIPNINKRCLP